MKKTIALAVSILLMILLFQSFYAGPETDARLSQMLAKANILNMQYPHEKVYLHLDRPSYWANDDIWFKAYLQNSPIVNTNLYVELLNASGTVVQKKIYWAQDGLAYGDFHLADTIVTGIYQIRAYTNWMRNFEEDGFFRKNIIVWNLMDKTIKSEANELKEKNIDVQFFPEGGTFVTGLESKMAFKVTDQNGKALEVVGIVTDEQGQEVATIKSHHKGMGSFMMRPKEGSRYKAKVMVGGSIEKVVDLPSATTNGVAMTITYPVEDQLQIKVEENHPDAATTGSEYMIVGRAAGKIFYRKAIRLENGLAEMNLEKNTLPDGIVQFTLFDKDLLPRCERLVFARKPEFIDINIRTDKNEYSRRGLVKLALGTFDQKGNPSIANLSMSVYHPESQMETEAAPNNILTQFLLNSELKGVIEDPAWYFKDDSLSTRLALDHLLLTHGWRHFEWEEIRGDQLPEIVHQPEESIQLKGTVKSIVAKKPLGNSKVTMMTVKSLLDVKEQKTDSLGRFLFTDLFFNDTIYVSLQAVNAKGKKNTVIEVDRTSLVSPRTTILPLTYRFHNEKVVNTTAYVSEMNTELINRQWRLSDTIMLSDIQIRAERTKKSDGHARVYTEPDIVKVVTKNDNLYANIFEMMDGRMAGIRFDSDAQAFYIRGNSSPALLLMDGAPANADMIASLSISSFDKIEVLKYAPMLGSKGNNGAIFFYMKRGVPQEYITMDALGMKSTPVVGYSVIRKFYAPLYESNINPAERKDFRNTLYWNPVVRTDSTGIAAVAFSNSDQIGPVQVVIEGITTDGKLCRGTSSYNVSQ